MKLTIAHQLAIEENFKQITEQLDIKPNTKTYGKYQGLFFSGAIAAIGETPPLWGICLLSGRSIIEERNKNKEQ